MSDDNYEEKEIGSFFEPEIKLILVSIINFVKQLFFIEKKTVNPWHFEWMNEGCMMIIELDNLNFLCNEALPHKRRILKQLKGSVKH